MKRLLAIAVCLTACVCASAQLKVVSKTEAWQTISSADRRLLKFQKQGDDYRLGIGTPVTNGQDWYYIFLGTGLPSAMQTLNDLYEFANDQNDMEAVIMNRDQEVTLVSDTNIIGQRIIKVYKVFNPFRENDYCVIGVSELERLIEKIQEVKK